MVRKESQFGFAEGMTPDIAARLAQLSDRYSADLQLACGDKCVRLDSLIGILSVPCRRGTPLAVIAEGDDEQAAAEAVAALLRG